MPKAKKLMSKQDVVTLIKEIGSIIGPLRDCVHGGAKLNIDNEYLLKLLEKARRAIIQLERPRRDFS